MKFLSMRFNKVFLGLLLINSAFAAYTAVQYFPENAIYEIDESTLNAKKILDTADVGAVSITNDPLTGNMFVVTGLEAGVQTLNRLCEGKLHPIAPISSPAVNLYCLTSGPNGVYAAGIDETSGEISVGKLDVTTGEWTTLAPLLASYDSVVLAQNDKGVIHHINGNGKTFINPGSKPKMDVLRGTKFSPGFKDFCGEFDDDGHIISTTDELGGGISKYNLKSERIKISQLNETSEFFFNDITIGSISDACPSDAPSMVPKSSKKGSKKQGSKSAKKKKNKKKNKTKTQNKIESTDKKKKNKDKKEGK